MKRETLLENYKTFGKEIPDFFGTDVKDAGEAVVEILREKGLTYEEAYASLEYADRTLGYESKFLVRKQS